MLYHIFGNLTTAIILITYFSLTTLFYIWLSKKTTSARLKYNVASVLCFLPLILNLGFIRMILFPLFLLFFLFFFLTNNFCCKYLTEKTKLLNCMVYILYALHNLLLPDSDIRVYTYILGGLIRHRGNLAWEKGDTIPLSYLFMDGLMDFLVGLSVFLIILLIILLIVQLILCIKEKQKIKHS